MSATYRQAQDDIFKAFKDAWDPTGWLAQYPNVAGYIGPTEEDATTTQPVDVPWARIVLRHATGAQNSMRGLGNKQQYNRSGTLFVQVFDAIGSGLGRLYDLAKIVSDAYEGKTTEHCVWFRNVRIQEVGPSGGFEQLNVKADFYYLEIK